MTARATCLHRAIDLDGFRRAVYDIVVGAQPFDVREHVVVVPTGAAADELRRTLETLAWQDGRAALWEFRGSAERGQQDKKSVDASRDRQRHE